MICMSYSDFCPEHLTRCLEQSRCFNKCDCKRWGGGEGSSSLWWPHIASPSVLFSPEPFSLAEILCLFVCLLSIFLHCKRSSLRTGTLSVFLTPESPKPTVVLTLRWRSVTDLNDEWITKILLHLSTWTCLKRKASVVVSQSRTESLVQGRTITNQEYLNTRQISPS